MAKKPSTATVARVLVDLPSFGARLGQILQSTPDAIATLTADGSVDPHPDAVAYAEREALGVVVYPPEQPEEPAAEALADASGQAVADAPAAGPAA